MSDESERNFDSCQTQYKKRKAVAPKKFAPPSPKGFDLTDVLLESLLERIDINRLRARAIQNVEARIRQQVDVEIARIRESEIEAARIQREAEIMATRSIAEVEIEAARSIPEVEIEAARILPETGKRKRGALVRLKKKPEFKLRCSKRIRKRLFSPITIIRRRRRKYNLRPKKKCRKLECGALCCS